MPQSPLRIMLIEDSESYAGLLKIHLTRAISGVRLFHEITLAGGIESLTRETADAVILDLNLPDSRGIDTFAQLQARFPHTPVIVLTGYEDEEIATLAMRLGAEDYLNKNDIDGRSLVRSIRYAIERHRHQEGLHALEAAGAIQRTLFPHGPLNLGGLEITGRCDSMLATGGDYYDYFPLDERRMALVVADVSGHGIGPA